MGTEYKIVWIGWNYEGTSDKVWGYLQMADGRYFSFWGRRGKTLRFKDFGNDHYSVQKLSTAKANAKPEKRYNFVDPVDYNRLVKDFVEELELHCMAAILSDTVR